MINTVVIFEKGNILNISNLRALLENCQKYSLCNKFAITSNTLQCMICKEQVSSDSPDFVT